ncbi:MAG: aspartate aminotransferase family protein [Spirochaetes bacterium]|uniref:Aspartate aminotransferase family protein n=1 Tax=Candidatus Ornithospirochaeta stercoripullorum TaxID=2840899 RepID=A0A9D9E0H5_9SPIO|nr:aspartate aminotransferase family protein [Candidatus Ornithospirochaeta stercoripullorum]
MSNQSVVELGKANYMNNYSQFPIAIKSGKGMVLVDEDGKEYLDFVAGIAVNALGYGDEDEKKALFAVIENGVFHTSNLYYNAHAVTVANLLNELAGSEEVFLCNSGAEANEAALKMARKYGSQRGRDKIISFHHSFHGRTYGAITVTGQEKYHKGFAPMLPGVVYAEYNNIDSVKALVDEQTAAIIVEPLQGEGGIIPAEQSFLSGLRKLADDNDMLLIFDEVQCGMGRTGKPFCFQNYGIQPDILTSAKALGGGLPMGATLAFKRAKGIFSPGDHAATFGGNVAAAALAEVVLKKLPSLSENAAENGAYLGSKLDELAKKYPQLCVEARGMGFMRGLELKIAPRDVIAKCMEKGLLVCSAGYTVLRFVPPLVASKNDIDKAIAIVDEALSEI